MRTTSLTLSAALLLPAAALAAPAGGLGPYHIGMSPAEVQAVRECAPYKPVAATGGLECPAFPIAGKKRNVSFVFDPAAGLKKIQVWFYEGQDAASAQAALGELIAYATREYGPLESNALPTGAPVTAPALMAALGNAATAKAQFKPRKAPTDAFVFSSLIHDAAQGWYVFFYVQPPR